MQNIGEQDSGVKSEKLETSGLVESGNAQASDTQLYERVQALRGVRVFADLPEDQLRWFAENAEERRLEAGDILFSKGDPPEWMVVYLEGEVHARRDESTLEGFVYMARAGDPATEVTGMLPFSRMTEFGATGRAITRTRLLAFPVRLFPEMLQRMPVLAERLVGLMSDRVREVTKADQQRDKLIALGKLSAGLAHELNNPAAAAGRAADELLETLEELRAADLRLCRHNLTPEQRAFIAEFEHEAIARHATAPSISALAQSDHEDELITWLDEQGIEDGWKMAPTLVEAGVDGKGLERALKQTGSEALADVLTRFAAQLSTAKLVSDIKTSTGRIAELVGAIKEYTYMDQSPVQEVDVHKGLDNTLLILKYKLKNKGINVVREYAENLPRITAYGSELNQVWTNLIDNAVDAMTKGGELKIHTKREPTDLLVEIRDNGAGIPPEVQTRIFEPFYTTKPVGEGTGLGLDAVLRIVRKHHGNIRVESRPGDTCFQVRLPFTQG
ncbi:MAG: cyclic nucleotide-binding domain-containing protein [Pyrinomonadaceae bacterium]|nr:cyclic nucleotide-binding domain-containing protein [Pyrinomonadaceae bacterium]